MADVDDLNAYLDKHPDDHPTRLLLADAHEEAGRAEWAAGYRWLARRQKRPFRVEAGYAWYDEARANATGIDPESDLPPAVFQRLAQGKPTGNGRRTYPTRRSAEEDAVAAFALAVAAGWAPA